MTSRRSVTHTLSVLPDAYAICRLPAAGAIPEWAAGSSAGVVAIVRTEEELSVLCPESRMPPDLVATARGGWRALVVHGPLPFEMVGVIAGLSSVLAGEGISLLTVATFETDYLFVQAEALPRAIAALQRAGHAVEERLDAGRVRDA